MAATNNALNNSSSTSIASATQTFTISNSNNTGTSAASLAISVGGGTTSGDPKTTYTVTGVTNWSQGIDNSASDAFKISASTALGTTDTVVITTAGAMTKPLQPAFLAYVGTDITDVTGDGTAYTIIFDTEVYDQSSSYNNATGVFTAPVTGRYYFKSSSIMLQLGALFTSGNYKGITSNRQYLANYCNPGVMADASSRTAMTVGFFADMDSGDTCSITVTISGSTKTIDVDGFTDPSSYFSGSLIC